MLKIWQAVRNCRDSRGRHVSKLFLELPDQDEYPDYFEEITKPIALDTIKENIETGKYHDILDLGADLNLMFENAKQYNAEGSQIYNDALFLQNLSAKLIAAEYPQRGNLMQSDPEINDTDYIDLTEVEHNGETYRVGDYVHIRNEDGLTKPNVAHIFRLWKNQNSSEVGVNVCWYYHPEQTVHQATRSFYENEIFKTNAYNEYLISEVIEKVFVVPVREAMKGRPKNSAGKTVYVCESRYNEAGKNFSKIKNWSSTYAPGFAGRVELEYYPQMISLKRVKSPLAGAFEMIKTKPKQEEPSPQLASVSHQQVSQQTRTASPLTSQVSLQSVDNSNTTTLSQYQSPATQAQSSISSRIESVPSPIPRYDGYSNNNNISTSEYRVKGSSNTPQYTTQYAMQHTTQPTTQPTMQHTMQHTAQHTAQHNMQTQPSGHPSQTTRTMSLSAETANQFACNAQGEILWFATPPVDVTPLSRPQHSKLYMEKRVELLAERENINRCGARPDVATGMPMVMPTPAPSKVSTSFNAPDNPTIPFGEAEATVAQCLLFLANAWKAEALDLANNIKR